MTNLTPREQMYLAKDRRASRRLLSVHKTGDALDILCYIRKGDVELYPDLSAARTSKELLSRMVHLWCQNKGRDITLRVQRPDRPLVFMGFSSLPMRKERHNV